jgi:1-deoxy-D-xylulose-5-phosphate synthase
MSIANFGRQCLALFGPPRAGRQRTLVTVTRVLGRVDCPADLRALTREELVVLSAEIRDLLVQTVSRTGGHLGPNLGAVELTLALHRVFDSPTEPILFDVGHQAYVHKIVTGRAARMSTLRQAGGISGYPSRAESEHDWIENSHASTALSYADGLAKAFEVRGERRPVVAVVGDGALTGGMCWEALNNIAGADRPVVIVVNDNGRSYSPTAGGFADHLAGLRLRPGYERMLDTVKHGLPRLPVVGRPVYEALHGMKRGIKDLLAPQGMFEDLGLKYLGPVDGHDLTSLENALELARGFDGPVIVHCVTRKGYGYAPAENDEADQMHQSRGFDPVSGLPTAASGRTWTDVFSDELVKIGEQRDDVVAITAAMSEPTGLGAFARRFPGRSYDVGIAEQHALTSAAGIASGGLHPVVAVYATFLNRAFDQLLMDVALHHLPVTVVLDRAGLTGDDGASHNGMWDLALLGIVPGLRIAAPRDEPTLRAELHEAIACDDAPTVLRFPKTPLPADVVALRSIGGVDVLDEPSSGCDVDILVVAVGATAADVLAAVASVRRAGYSVRVVDPRWVGPVNPVLAELARGSSLVVTVEDGVASGGVGTRLSQHLRAAGVDVATREIGIPTRFLDHGKVHDVRAEVGMTVPDIGRRIVEWSALVQRGDTSLNEVPAAEREREINAD